MALFFSSVPLSRDSVTVSCHAQYQDPENEAAKWNSAVINYIIYICAFSTVTCQNAFVEIKVTKLNIPIRAIPL